MNYNGRQQGQAAVGGRVAVGGRIAVDGSIIRYFFSVLAFDLRAFTSELLRKCVINLTRNTFILAIVM